MPGEWAARILVGCLLVGLVTGLAVIFYQQNQIITVRARMPEQGGWSPGELHTAVGEPLELRLISEDVLHSFAVGQTDLPVVELQPGEAEEVTLTFDRPGKYTYYCTRWCGPNHWRMRGTIDVSSEETTVAASDSPLYAQLGLDIDAPHPAQNLPATTPVKAVSAGTMIELPEKYISQQYYRSHSPSAAWQDLRADPNTQILNDLQVWELVAGIWQGNTTPERLDDGQALYTQNCAACHGTTGGGDGVFAASLESHGKMDMSREGQMRKAPAAFNDPESMLGASPALLQGKILRGGMGTGMPYWGPIFTEDQTWVIVEYLYSFQFRYDEEAKP